MLTFKRLLGRRCWIPCLPFLIGVSLPLLGAQQPKDAAPPAPVPTQIAAARKLFIANAPGENVPKSLGAPDRPYNEFYQAMKNSRGYELVTAPAEADLIFEISFASSLSGVSGSSNTGCSSFTDYSVRLVILDPKMRVPLWWFSEPVALHGGFSNRKETLDSVFIHSIAALVDDVRSLTHP